MAELHRRKLMQIYKFLIGLTIWVSCVPLALALLPPKRLAYNDLIMMAALAPIVLFIAVIASDKCALNCEENEN